MKNLKIVVFTFFILIASSQRALAIPPPDMIFSAGAQLMQVFSFLFIFIGTAYLASIQFLKLFFYKLKINWKIVLIGLILVITISGLITYIYKTQFEKNALSNWTEESKSYIKEQEETSLITPTPSNISATQQIPPDTIIDPEIEFIQKFYKDIELQNLELAYSVSSKKYDYPTFTNLYKNVDKIEIEEINKINEKYYNISLKMSENGQLTKYNVNLELGVIDRNYFISSSSVVNTIPIGNVAEQTNNVTYIAKAISNEELKQLVKINTNHIILDAREDEEYDIGNYPGSIHIRLADLYSGKWEQIDSTKQIYVFCWSGIRGKEVAEFLNTKGLTADYVAEGANGWVESGGTWQGEIKFSKAYTNPEFSILLTYEQVKQAENNGTLIIDSREKSRYDFWHIPNSTNISIITTPSEDIDKVLSVIPANSKIIAICDDVVNCFDSRILGLKLEKYGHNFLGRYNKPWEYRNNLK
ncbi:rhodanese-like domain-containing protein [Candidatus Dojkabacteria bacterium]|nr:rhodanese-like domain-containing protein [Candidatus Dojkabacteria bacterium]